MPEYNNHDGDEYTRDGQYRLQRLRVGAKLMLAMSAFAVLWVLVSSSSSTDPAVRALPDLQVDIDDLVPGTSKTILWAERPVIIVRRTPSQLAALNDENPSLLDAASAQSEQPAFAVNHHRSSDPEWFVAIALGTDLNCVVELRPVPASLKDTCRGSEYDLAGRVMAGQYATSNLTVPPYTINGSTMILGREVWGASPK